MTSSGGEDSSGVSGDLTDRPAVVRKVLRLLLVVTAASAALAAFDLVQRYLGMNGLLVMPGRPFGDDFINLWTVALLIRDGAFDTIYLQKAFTQFQEALVGGFIGFRLWAYPPHSLLFAAPFAYFPYLISFLLWTGLGLAVLAAGARRLGFTWIETAIVTLSPAAMLCVFHGQSGNLVAGLLMFALSGDMRGASRPVRGPALAAALLTIKPQAGFLLPVLWLLQRCWMLIALTSLLALGLVGLSLAIFGASAWINYVEDTLPALSLLEREGSGPFLLMIPSVFISMRLLGWAAAEAFTLQLVFSALVFAILVWRLVVVADPTRRVVLILIATCLITPYLHIYDMTILLIAALLLLRSAAPGGHYGLWPVIGVTVLSWLLPRLVPMLGLFSVPISPLLMLIVFAVACILPASKTDEALPADRQTA